jgi:hypothetical protein
MASTIRNSKRLATGAAELDPRVARMFNMARIAT